MMLFRLLLFRLLLFKLLVALGVLCYKPLTIPTLLDFA
jgi:hypothetical protein